MPLYRVTVTSLVLAAAVAASSMDTSYDANLLVSTASSPGSSASSPGGISASSTGSSACPGCAMEKKKLEDALSASELRQIKIEYIKQQILTKLRLKAPPRLTVTKSELPSILAHGEALSMTRETHRLQEDRMKLNQDSAPAADEYYGTTKNVVVLPENSTGNLSCQCSLLSSANPSNCFSFRISPSKVPGSVSAAELWLFKTRRHPNNQSLVVSEIVHDRSCGVLRKRILALEQDPPGNGWIRFNLRNAVSRWVTKPHLLHSIEITCKGCAGNPLPMSLEERRRPFLVITTGPPELVRRKRGVDCSETSTRCCKESFYLSFKEVGWDNWIIHPPGYTANFCKGACLSDVSATRYHHSSVLQRYIQSQRAREENPTLSLCCTPSRMSSISLIYLDDDGSIFQKNLPNMVVEACDCA